MDDHTGHDMVLKNANSVFGAASTNKRDGEAQHSAHRESIFHKHESRFSRYTTLKYDEVAHRSWL